MDAFIITLLIQIIRHALQMSDGVYILDMHIIGHVQAGGGVVQDRLYASLDKLIGHFLCGSRGDGEHSNFDLVLFYFFSHYSGIENFEFSHLLPYLFRIIIKYHTDLETAVVKPIITGECVSYIARANNYHVPASVHF